VLSGLAFAGIEETETLRRLRELAFGFHRDLASRADKPRWVSKTAMDAFYVPEIEQLCGDHVKYVCMLRHGLDVVCSLEDLCQRTGVYLAPLHEYTRRWPSPREAFAHAWADVTEALLDLAERRPAQTHVVRYEDLVSEPARTLHELLSFLGEDADALQIERALSLPCDTGLGDWKAQTSQEIAGSSMGRGKSLPPTEVSYLAPVLEKTLARAGYSPLEVRRPPTAEGARRRYRLSLTLPSLIKRG
jgi:hypothetical protein